MKRTLKKRNKKRRINKRKTCKGGMFSRFTSGISRRLEPNIERKIKEWGSDIIEAKAKKTDTYEETKNKINEYLVECFLRSVRRTFHTSMNMLFFFIAS